MRPSGRKFDELRPIILEPDFAKHAEGSCLAMFGETKVFITASVEQRVPGWIRDTGHGWVTAEYGMLPRATNTRTNREAKSGHQSGRTQEIQRLIGRSLRSIVDLESLGERQIKVDCDVIQADGGTRTASISGGFVALHQAVTRLKKNYNINKPIIKEFLGAVSAGIINNQASLDLDYKEDANAQVDANFVICESGKISEIQVTGEENFFSDDQFNKLFELSKKGIAAIIKKQKNVLSLQK